MSPLLLCTHLFAFALGVPSGLYAARHTPRRSTRQEPRMAVRRPAPRRWSTGTIIGVCVLLGSLFIIGLGVQQARYQDDAAARDRAAADRDACYETWGKELLATTRSRVKATGKVEAAEQARDDAADNVFLLVLGLRSQQPPPTAEEADRDFDRVLRRFAVAKSDLDRVLAERDTTRRKNPYPELDCAGADRSDTPAPSPSPR